MEFQSRISQSDAHTVERRTYPANDYFFGVSSGDDESADEHVVSRKNPHSGGDIDRHASRRLKSKKGWHSNPAGKSHFGALRRKPENHSACAISFKQIPGRVERKAPRTAKT